MRLSFFLYLTCAGIFIQCKTTNPPGSDPSMPLTVDSFPPELVVFRSHQANPVFKGSGQPTWDENIRERGFVLLEDQTYYLWYTGYRGNAPPSMSLGLATSSDGYTWTRYPGNPIFDSLWTEDMMVVRSDSTYYMFAEGKDDIAHMLTSGDRIHWTEKGKLDIRKTDGSPIEPGPYGTPTVWIEDGIWYLFYERNDEGIWLATSRDRLVWTNVQDQPILNKGPEAYDRYGVAMNQVLKYKGKYYGYYHGTSVQDWSEWGTHLAVSPDLIKWTKYPGNPVLADNKSSGILVDDGIHFRLYTMHPEVCVHEAEKK